MVGIKSRAKLVFLLLITVLLTGACGNRSNGGEEVDGLDPTVTPPVEIATIPTFTPTVAVVVSTATPTEAPTLTPTSTPVAQGQINIQANLRSGPGVVYDIVGVAAKGSTVIPVSQTRDRLWLKLNTGAWIFAELVDDIPLGLPVETNILAPPLPTATPTPPPATDVPPTATLVPTATSVPVEGDWSVPIHRNVSFLMPDGLEIKVQHVIYGNDDRMQSYIERRGGQNCDGCLAIGIEIVNKDGNSKEYVAQEDFKLLERGPDGQSFQQVRCSHANGLRSMTNPGALRAYVKGLGGGFERFLCFEGVSEISLDLRMAYSPVFIYEDPNTPTPTPVGSSVVYATEPIEEEQQFRTGWSVYFLLLGI